MSRYPIMNDIAIPMKNGKGSQDIAIGKMLDFFTLTTRLENGGILQVKSVFLPVPS
jgi:hypothetical protein